MEAEEIIDRIPWRCFFCDFITTDRAEAAAHFGDRDDPQESTPLCKWWTSMQDDERVKQLQDTLQQLDAERDANYRLSTKVEALEYQVENQESVIKSYKPFKDCRTIHDIFCLYDSMEGRALAAKELEQIAESNLNILPVVEENLADYAKRYYDLFEMYKNAWLREMGGVIRPKWHPIDGFVLRAQDIYEKAKEVDRIKKIMVDEVKRSGATKDSLFDAVFRYLAESGKDKIPTN